ncbi:hypothetical protein MAM1_0084c04668 [Mucor ambiguus]|uniref:PX domain-containing protein n=1 Tax=Mucor ambiguus TaxID=91626 RepID=A0A0C9MCX7_9FUNG|nr:hypothetical protein MAM1_0084c04668 [Mucor ambiguus]
MISCPIKDITVQPYTKQPNGTWYPIQLKLGDGHMLEIQHQYANFIQFSRLIHQQFSLSSAELPKIKKQHNFLKKGGAQKYLQRQCELQAFCRLLLLLPPVVTCSPACLSFFSATPALSTASNSLKKAFSLKSSSKKQQQQHPDLAEINHAFSRSLAISISQHESQLQQCTSRPTIQNINRSNRCSTTSTISTVSSSILFSSSLSSTEEDDTIKLKIIYDVQNIIIIRVVRSVSLDQLRSQVIQKFALINIMLPDQLVLRTVDCARYSSGSGSSIVCSVPANSDLGADELISNEQDLSRAMLLKWNTLQKVTLRCVV